MLEKIKWALAEKSKQKIVREGRVLNFSVMDNVVSVHKDLPVSDSDLQIVSGKIKVPNFSLPCLLKNISDPPTTIFGQLMLFTKSTSKIVPVANKQPLHPFKAASLSIQYGLDFFYPLASKNTGALSPSGITATNLEFKLNEGVTEALETFLIRVQYSAYFEDFYFQLKITMEQDVPSADTEAT